MNKIFLSISVTILILGKMSIAHEKPPEDKFESARSHFNLTTNHQTLLTIPTEIRTGNYQKFYELKPDLSNITLDNYEEVFTRTRATIPQILEAFPPNQWKKMFDDIKTIQLGSDSSSEQITKTSSFPTQEAIEARTKIIKAQLFLNEIYNAYPRLPTTIANKCPAVLIADCQFTNANDVHSKATKFARLGLLLKGAMPPEKDSFFLIAEAFHEAAAHFRKFADVNAFSSNDLSKLLIIIDIYLSSAQCFNWAGINYPDNSLSQRDRASAQQVFILGHNQFNQAYKLLRLQQPTDNGLKAALRTYLSSYVKWSKDYFPSWYSESYKQYVKNTV